MDAGPKTQAGPLGRVDPPRPDAPASVPRPPLGLATGALLLGIAGMVASLVVLGTIADGVHNQEVFLLDAWATPFLHDIQSPGFNALMTGLTAMGSTIVVLPIFLLVGGALVATRRFGAAVFLTVALVGSLVIDAAMKLVFERPRPKLDYAAVLPDYSFPSGHAMNGVVFYVSIALIAWSVFGRRIGLVSTIAAGILAIGIGLSRIYLGFHYMTDVIGGWLAGIVWLLIVGAIFRIRPNVWRWGRIGRARRTGTDTAAST